MAFPPQFLDELRARVVLSEVIGKRIPLVRAGREMKACCPFHKEKTPSFTINDQKGFFHCFGCGAHGDVVGFVMRHDGLEFLEAVEQLAGLAGLPMPRRTPEDEAKQKQTSRLNDLMETATRWFAARLYDPAGAEARAYLTRRGIDAEAIAQFRIGYAPADGAALRGELRRAGFSDPEMVEAGLLREPAEGRGGAPYSFFRDRVIIPIGDIKDRTISFGARSISAQAARGGSAALSSAQAAGGGSAPKYLNGPDSPLFRKGETVFNLAKARAEAKGDTPFLVVEGYFDVISLSRNGFGATVAPLGTALTEEQMRAVWRAMRADGNGIKAPVLCFDGDDAGRRAAHRFAERVLPVIEPSLTVRFTFLPQGEDPDSLVRQTGGRERFGQCVAEARPLVDFLWDWKLSEQSYETPEERATLRRYFLDKSAEIQDRSLQQLYRDELLNRCFQLWRARKGEDAGKVVSFPDGPKEGQRTLVAPPPDVLLVAILINHAELLEDFLGGLDLIHFGKTGHTHTVFRFASSLFWEEPGLERTDFQQRISAVDAAVGPIVERLNAYYLTHCNGGLRPEDEVREIFLDRLRLLQMQRLREDLKAAYRRAQTGSDPESDRITYIIAELARLRDEQNAVLDRPNHGDLAMKRGHIPIVSYESKGLPDSAEPARTSALAVA